MPRKARTKSDPVIAKAEPAPKPTAPGKPAAKKRLAKKRNRRWPLGKAIEIERHREKILELRAHGASIKQISDRLKDEYTAEVMAANPGISYDEAQAIVLDGTFGVSKSQVHRILEDALNDFRATNLSKVEDYVTLELYKLDQEELSIFSNLKRIAEIDRNTLKAFTASVERGDVVLSQSLAKQGFYSDDVDKYSKSMERIRKNRYALLGLNKPVRHEHTGEGGKPIETSIVTRVILPRAPVPEQESPEDGDEGSDGS